MLPGNDPHTRLRAGSERSCEIQRGCAAPTAGQLSSTAKRPRRFWRFASPSALLLALVVFPLPWVQVRCDRNTPSVRNIFNDAGLSGEPWDSLSFWERDSVTVMEQSGLQAAIGVCSPANEKMASEVNDAIR